MCARRIQSTQVGLATLPTGTVTTAYRAIVDLTCAACGSYILPGKLFSRRAAHMGAAIVTPTCTRCRPLRWEDAGEDESAVP